MIDWDAARSGTTDPDAQAVLDELRIISDLATLHRAPHDWFDEATQAAPRTWGPLTILSSVGSGRFGDVYIAWYARLHQRVALKLLRRPASSSAAPTEAIEEARLLARVRHPNVLSIYGAECIDDQIGIWTEYIEGRTLDALVAERGPLDPKEVVEIGVHLCNALQAVHDAGLLHRDIKPQNVMRETGGRIVLMDFGTGHDLTVTEPRPGDLSGTPLYLAPEVFAGGAPSRASDIYALGVVLFYLLTGQYPVSGRTAKDVQHAHQQGRVRRIAELRGDVPKDLRAAIDKALSVEAANRPTTAKALLGTLLPAPVRTTGRGRLLITAAAVLAAAAIGWSVLNQPVPEPVASTTKSEKVWEGQGVYTSGTVSADGRYLSAEMGSDVELRELATGRHLRVVTAGDSGNVAADRATAVSRDGTQVAYAWRDPSRPLTIRAATFNPSGPTAPRTLIELPDANWALPYDWSPDGKWIAVSGGRKDRTAFIGLLSTTGSGLEVLKDIDWRGAARMFFSPDGRLLAYDHAIDVIPQRDVFVMDLESKKETPVVQHRANDVVTGWAPDGRLIFTSDRSNANALWAIAVTETGEPKGNAKMIYPDLGTRSFTIGLTAKGTLVYGLQTSSVNVYYVDVDLETGKILGTPSEAIESYMMTNEGPDWSKNGKQLLFRTNSPKGLSISVLDVETGKTIREFRPPMESFNRARWAPDGSITVQGSDLTGNGGLFRIDAETGALSALVAGPAQQATWHPNGNQLVFRRQGPKGNVLVVHDKRDGTDQELVSRIMPICASLSPDGTQITYAQVDPNDPKTSRLYVRPLLGGPTREVFRAVSPDELANVVQWSPDGKYLIFGTNRQRLWVVRSSGGDPIEIKGHGMSKFNANPLSIDPSNRRLALNLGDPARSVWTLTNFLKEATTK